MKMDVLRCKTPEMVEKEVWIHLFAYNLIRGVAPGGGGRRDMPREVSFKGTLADDDGVPGRAAMGETERERLVAGVLRAIARTRVGDRPGRVEPRANKRRPKPHKLLIDPRKQRANACCRRLKG